MKKFTLLKTDCSEYVPISLDTEIKEIDQTLELKQIEEKLSEVKNKLDKYYIHELSRKNFDQILRQLDIYRSLKRTLTKNSYAQCVTNAWLKTWEIIFHFSLIPPINKTPVLSEPDGWHTISRSVPSQAIEYAVHFHACLPGSPISAVNHYINTLNGTLNWTASVFDNSVDEDTFHLKKNYRNQWIDLSVTSVIKELADEKLIDKNLYISDLGLDIQENYNDQEKLHGYSNLLQIYIGLSTLKVRGSMCTKQYTFFTPFTISVMLILCDIFEEVHICKPASSKIFNSETYLVCKNYLGCSTEILGLLNLHLNTFYLQEHDKGVPLFDLQYLDERQLNNVKIIIEAARTIFTDQIESIEFAIEIYEKHMKDTTMSLATIAQEIKQKYNPESKINAWLRKYPVKTLKTRGQLMCVDS